MTTDSTQKATLHPVTLAANENAHSDTDWKAATVAAILAAHEAGWSYGAMGNRWGFNSGWLHMVAHGKRQPTPKLARALGIAVELPDDRVRFGVWMTRQQRDELQATIDAECVLTRLEWVQMAAAETRAQHALREILRWCNAYSLAVFPEPDLARVRELLEAGGVTLDSVSASTARHVLAGVAEIAREGIA